MLHESFINHDFIVKVVIAVFLLHTICWTLVYYLAFKYGLVCIPYEPHADII